MKILNTTDSHNVHVFCDTTDSRNIRSYDITTLINDHNIKLFGDTPSVGIGGGSSCSGLLALGRQRDNVKYVASKGTFPQAKEFLRKLSAIWVRVIKNFASPS
jgi:hypothetical protein